MKRSEKIRKRERRIRRTRAKVNGTQECPRLSVFRSHKHIYVQLIDDTQGETLVSASDLNISPKDALFKESELPDNLSKGALLAYQVGLLIAQRAKEKNIIKIVFDKRGYKYHGRVKALAEGARAGGLQF